MARAATSPELALFRTEKQWSKTKAAIFVPHVVYQARINQTFSTLDGVLAIIYDNGSGTFADVFPDMTLFIGSSAGAYDIGIVRLRGVDATHFYIGETSNVRFADELHLTVVDDYGLWARHVFISGGVAYMDGGVGYTDQHAAFDPVAIMGGNRVLELTGASVSASFDWSLSYVIDSTITGYSCVAPTASSSSGMTTSTPTITWNSTGWHLVYLTLTAANGKSVFAVRYVFVWNKDNPPTEAEIGSPCQQDAETGGWTFDLTLFDNADLDSVRDHALVILFEEAHYGDTQQSIGALSGCENIVVTGWIAKESINLNPEQGKVQFTAYGAHYWLGQIPSYPDGVEFTTYLPEAWTQMQNLTVRKGLWHFLHWRTTATRIMDVFLPDDTKYTKETSSLAQNLWEQIREIGFMQIFARAGVNEHNQLFIETHPQLVPVASRSWPTVMAITEEDWEGEINFERVIVQPTAGVSLSGVAVDSLGNGVAYFSLSPGHAYPHYGRPELVDRLLLSSQAQANTLCGLYFEWKNNPLPDIPIVLSANNRLIGCFPRQKCTINIAAADNVRGVAYNGGLIPKSVAYVQDKNTGYLHTEVTFEAETLEGLAVNGDVPGSGDVSIPPTPPLPSLPDIPIILPGTTEPTVEGAKRVLIHDTTYGLLYSSDFHQAGPHWVSVNGGLTDMQYQNINAICVTPSGGIYVAYREADYPGHLRPDIFIAYASSIGGTFTILEDLASLKVKFPAPTYSEWAVRALAVNPLTGQAAYLIVGKAGGSAAKLYVGSGTSWTSGLDITGYSAINYVASLSYGFGAWLLSGPSNAFVRASHWTINPAGTSILSASDLLSSGMYQHFRAGATDKVFHNVDGSAGVWYSSTGNGAAYSPVYSSALDTDYNTIGPLGANPHVENYQDCDPTGTFLMLDAFTTAHKGKSSDGGATIVALASLPVGNWHFRYAGSTQRWVAAGGSSIRYTEDFGVIWINKEGYLSQVAPIPSIDMVRVVGY